MRSNLALKGITTDGSALYPEPIRTDFGEAAHQICTFHVLKELTQGILSAVAAERRPLAKAKPKTITPKQAARYQAPLGASYGPRVWRDILEIMTAQNNPNWTSWRCRFYRLFPCPAA